MAVFWLRLTAKTAAPRAMAMIQRTMTWRVFMGKDGWVEFLLEGMAQRARVALRRLM
jgi:hypothetical protein